MQSTRRTNGSPLISYPPLPMDREGVKRDFLRHYTLTLNRDRYCRSTHYRFMALALTVRDRLVERWKNTRYACFDRDITWGYYLSMEYLLGRSLGNALLNLGLDGVAADALRECALELEEIAEGERDSGLGNGGLGRLAACFLDSCATLGLPVMGYGIRYEYGMFRQKIVDGRQVEEPDHWLRGGHPWEIERPEYTQRVRFGGRTEYVCLSDGTCRVRWTDTRDVLAIPYDIPVPGYRNGVVNTLRLWRAAATDEFNLGEFNAGSYPESVAAKNEAEKITMVLYPNDASENGKELRLMQQYFLASASLQDVIGRWRVLNRCDFSRFAEKNRFQLNDTHPTCVVPELMRILMDDEGMGWDDAWGITSRTVAYTNHTLLPEALERWPVDLFRRLLPRILEIILEINARFLREVAQRYPGDTERLRRMSIIEEGAVPMVRMAYLAIVASFSVNGVAALHSRLLTGGLFRDFYELWPGKFGNKTNGVTPRRWLAACNPPLRRLISSRIGDGWVTDMARLRDLEPYADDPLFRQEWEGVRRYNRDRLARLVARECGVLFPPDALYDVQVKRIHEYKRQLLNILHVIHLYDRIRRGERGGVVKRGVLIGGKAAPGYAMAKLIIHLITSVASVVNSDPAVGDLLKVAFIPDYRVTLMETICSGADLSEQISTAGKEASGTGNMKFMMNGAVTIGTLDGANIEILEEVGEENFFCFGLTAEEVEETRRGYDPERIIAADHDLQRVLHLIAGNHFSLFSPGIFDPIVRSIRSPADPWMIAADFRSYVDAQQRVAEAFSDRSRWTRMSIINCARSGRFSSDRTIQEYNRDIWRLDPITPLP